MNDPNPTYRRGRGAISNPDSRYSSTIRENFDDGWFPQERSRLTTTVTRDSARSLLTRNDSPDIPFEQSINAYRGCEHGCIYCFARPSHAWLGLSPGLDFESRLFAKPEAASLLRRELVRRNYLPKPIALGANTDPYQPVEREWRLTREILEVLQESRHPVSITTKSALIERDLDLLAELARDRLVQVQISITTLRRELARQMEPRAATPDRRLQTLSRLSMAGIPVAVLVAPVIPVLTDGELESILARAAEAGAGRAGYILLRLPLELEDLFREWLFTHVPGQAEHVLSRMRDAHAGRIYRSGFGIRQTGSGPYADMIGQRFRLALKRLRLEGEFPDLNTGLFRAPRIKTGPVQMSLF